MFDAKLLKLKEDYKRVLKKQKLIEALDKKKRELETNYRVALVALSKSKHPEEPSEKVEILKKPAPFNILSIRIHLLLEELQDLKAEIASIALSQADQEIMGRKALSDYWLEETCDGDFQESRCVFSDGIWWLYLEDDLYCNMWGETTEDI